MQGLYFVRNLDYKLELRRLSHPMELKLDMLAETAPLKSESSQSAREETFSAPPLALAL